MKKRTFIISLFVCFITASLLSQDLYIKDKPQYKPAILHFSNGTIEKGEVKNFIERAQVFVSDPFRNFKSIEKQSNLTDNKFFFKPFGKEDDIIVYSKDLTKVILYPDEKNKTILEIKKIKTLKNQGKEITDTNITAWVSLVENGTKNLYAVNILDLNQKTLAWTQVYIGDPEEEYVISVFDYNNLNLFNVWGIDKQVLNTLELIFQDCPEVIEYIESESNKIPNKNKGKIARKKQKENLKNIRNSTKHLSRYQRMEARNNYYSNLIIDIYRTPLKIYNSECGS